MNARKQNSTGNPIAFFLTDSSNHIDGAAGLTPTVTLSKNGGAFAAAAGAVAEIGNGWYSLAGNATDRNTLGELVLHATATGADTAERQIEVVPYDPFDGNMGLAGLLGLAAAGASGGLPVLNAALNVTSDLNRIVGQAVTCPGAVAIAPYVGNANAALGVDASGRVDVGKHLGVAITLDGNNALNVNVKDWGGTAVGGMPNAGNVTVGGYATGQGPGALVWGDSQASYATAGTFGKLFGNLDATVSSRLATASYTTPPTVAQIATGIWQDLTSGTDFQTVGSIGKLLTTNLDAQVSTRLATTGYTTAPTSTQVAAKVWQDVTAGDFTVVGSAGKQLMALPAASAVAIAVRDVDMTAPASFGLGDRINSIYNFDSWSMPVPGAYDPGTAGAVLGSIPTADPWARTIGNGLTVLDALKLAGAAAGGWVTRTGTTQQFNLFPLGADTSGTPILSATMDSSYLTRSTPVLNP